MYYLIVDQTAEAGDVITHSDAHALPAWSDPRRVAMCTPAGQHLGRDGHELTALIADPAIRVLQVEPLTEPAVVAPGTYTCPQWQVTEVLPLATALGPQGQQVVDLAAASRTNRSDHHGLSVYVAWRQTQFSTPGESRSAHALDAAWQALRTAGADMDWWQDHDVPFRHGPELVAVAARDLLGTVPGWNADAYALLTQPWRCAFGAAHRDDALPHREPGAAPIPVYEPGTFPTPPAGTRFYALVHATNTASETDLLEQKRPDGALTNPALLQLSDDLDELDAEQTLPEAQNQVRVAVLAPLGEVAPVVEPGAVPYEHMEWDCPHGWRITELLPLSAAFGPDAEHVITLAQQGQQYLDEDSDAYDADRAELYHTAIDEQIELTRTGPGDAATDAAQHALDAAGMDGYWWASCATACNRGSEVLAVAARHLLDNDSAWNHAAYSVLTEPYRRAFGPVHPQDPAVPMLQHQ